MKKMMKVAAMLAAVVLAAGMTACQKKDGAEASGTAQKSAGTAKPTPVNEFSRVIGAKAKTLAKPTPVNEFSRELTKDASGVRILKYNGSAKSVVIPAEIEGLPVKEIGRDAFRGNETLKRVTIPDSVQVIYFSAFQDCTALESVTLGNSVQEIYGSAFQGCTALKSVTIPDSVQKIVALTFKGCTALKSVTLGNSVQEIGQDTFSGCTALESVTIPDSVQVI